jgi:hypothetical protein
MKEDAFDDVQCPFDYKAEMSKARAALNAKLKEYLSRDWQLGYRQLAKLFNLSPGTLCSIAAGCKPRCKPGPRTRRQKSAIRKMSVMIRRNTRSDAM